MDRKKSPIPLKNLRCLEKNNIAFANSLETIFRLCYNVINEGV